MTFTGAIVVASFVVSTLAFMPSRPRGRLARSDERARGPQRRGGDEGSKRLIGIGIVGAATVGVLVSSITITLIAIPVGVFVMHVVRRSKERAAARDRAAALSAFVDAVAQHLRSGSSLHGAIGAATQDASVASLSVEFEALRSSIEAGRTLDDALFELAASTRINELSLLATSVGVLIVHGGPVGPAIERVGELVRSAEAARQAGWAQASQATASAVVMAALPVVFAVVVGLIDRRMAAFYLTAPAGAVCVACAGTLAAAGWLWMDRLIWSST